MTKQHFTYKEIFSFAWSKTKQHAWFSVCTFLIASIIASAVRGTNLLECVVLMFIALSVASISLTIVRDHGFTFADLYKPLLSYRLVINFIILTILYVLGILISLIPIAGFISTLGRVPAVVSFVYLCLTPLTLLAVFLSVRFKFYPFVVLENEHMDLKGLIKVSYKVTEGNFWRVFGALMIICVLNIIGAILFGVGLLVTIPLSVFAIAHLYRRLVEHA